MNVLGLALASSLLVSSDLTCRGSIEEWSEFLTSFNVVVHNLLAPGSYCTGLNMFGKLIDPSDHLTGEVL